MTLQYIINIKYLRQSKTENLPAQNSDSARMLMVDLKDQTISQYYPANKNKKIFCTSNEKGKSGQSIGNLEFAR